MGNGVSTYENKFLLNAVTLRMAQNGCLEKEFLWRGRKVSGQ